MSGSAKTSKGVWIFAGGGVIVALAAGAYLLFGGPSADAAKSAAVRRVEKLEHQGDLTGLAQEAARQDDTEAAAAAVRSMGNIANDPNKAGAVRPQLDKALVHPKAEVRMEAAAQIGALAARQKLEQPPPALVNAALEDPDENVRGSAVQAIGQMNTPDTLDALVEALRDPDIQVRRFAFEALQNTMGYKVKPGSYHPESPSLEFYERMKAQVADRKQYLKQIRSKTP